MALTDPFATTYAGAFKGISSWGEALTGIAETYMEKKEAAAERKREKEEKEAEQQQSLDMLKQFGLIREEAPGFKDYSDIIKKETGKEVVAPAGASEQEKTNVARIFFGELGLPEPEPKYKLDEERAKVAFSGLVPGVKITGKEAKKGGYDSPEDIPQEMGGQPIKKIKQDATTGKWLAEYGPETMSFNERVLQALKQPGAGGEVKDKYGYVVGEPRKVRGKNYIYTGNNKWQEQ